MTDIWREWPHQWFGDYGSDSPLDPLFPTMGQWIDLNWQPHDLDRIVAYLKLTPICWLSQGDFDHACSLCGTPLPENSTWIWDGVWLWPYNLFHYVEKHSLRLPDAMVQRIRERDYLPPDEASCDLDAAEKVNSQLCDFIYQHMPPDQITPA